VSTEIELFWNRVSFLKEATYSAAVDISAIIILQPFTDYNIVFAPPFIPAR